MSTQAIEPWRLRILEKIDGKKEFSGLTALQVCIARDWIDNIASRYLGIDKVIDENDA